MAKTPWQYLGRKSHCWKAHFFKICFFVKYFRQQLLSLVNMGLHAAIIRLSPLIHEREQQYKQYIVSDARMVSLLWPPFEKSWLRPCNVNLKYILHWLFLCYKPINYPIKRTVFLHFFRKGKKSFNAPTAEISHSLFPYLILSCLVFLDLNFPRSGRFETTGNISEKKKRKNQTICVWRDQHVRLLVSFVLHPE